MSWTASARKISFGSVSVLSQLAQLLVVGVALGDRALEDRRVRRHAVDAIADERLELALLDEAAREEVDPDALAMGGELLQRRVGHGGLLRGSRGVFRGSRKRMPSAAPQAALPAQRRRKRNVSASAPGELAQPGGDRLLVAPCGAAASGASGARRDRVRLRHGAARRERRGGGGRRAEAPRPRRVGREGHRRATLPRPSARDKDKLVRCSGGRNLPCSAADQGMRDRDPEALLGLGEALVLAIVAVPFGMREDDDPVGGSRTGGCRRARSRPCG